MARKKGNSKELVQVSLTNHKWVNIPVVYTTFGSSFTSLQQDIMMQINGNLQDEITQFLNEGRYKVNERPKPIFTSQEIMNGLKPIRISLGDLGVGNGHYADVDKALEAIRELWVKAPEFDKETGLKKGENWYPVFRKVFIPESYANEEGEDYKYSNKSGKQMSRREGYIEVTINESVAPYVFDMSQGYFMCLERIALYCNSAYTSRLYLELMKYVSRGVMNPTIPYMEVKDFLGMIEREEKSDRIVNIKYEKFSQFRKQVLDVAMKDMERMSDKHNIEITFEYEPLYKGVVKRGDPHAIKFHIKRTALGIAREAELHRPSSENRLIKSLTGAYPSLESEALKAVFSDVPDYMWNDFKTYCYKEISKAVERPHRWDGTVESYVVWLMNEYIKGYGIKVIKQGQLELWGDVEDAELVDDGKAKRQKELWDKVVERLSGNDCLGGMKVAEDVNGEFILVPTKTFASLYAKEIEVLRSDGIRVEIECG